MKGVLSNPYGSQFLLRYLNPQRILVVVHACFYVQPRPRRRAANQIDHRGPTSQWSATPVLRDMAKHSMFNLVPFACARRKVANRDCQVQRVCQFLERHLPQSATSCIAPSRVRRDQQFRGLGVDLRPHRFPPATDCLDCELRCVVIDPHTYPPLNKPQIVDASGRHLAQLLVRIIVDLDLLRFSPWLPLSP
jgi:hypothetical protein